ncbi:MAG: hypothetical protein ABI318_20250 [Chthoniobacteraceae bacterium]
MKNMLLAHDHSGLNTALAGAFCALADGEVERSYNNSDLFRARLAMHIRAENIHLFPALIRASERSQIAAGAPALETVHHIIAQLRADHGFFMSELTEAVKELRELRRDDHQDSSRGLSNGREQLARVSRRLEAHNAPEESQACHWTGALLDEPAQNALNECMRLESDNLPPRSRKR